MNLRCLFAIVLLLVSITHCAARPADDGDALPALVQLLAASDDPQFHLDILKGMSEALKGRQNVKMPAGWAEASAKLSKSPNADVRNLTASLSTLFGDVKSLDAARKTAADKSAPPAERTKALTSLLDAKIKDLAPLLQQLLGDPPVRAQALRGLAAYDDPQTPSAILFHFNVFTPTEKLDALNTLASREAYALPLLKALIDKSIPRSDLTAATIRQLGELKNEQIDQWIKKNWGAVRTSPEDKIADMKRLKETILSAKPN
jgi:hypothetical protein